MSLRVMLMFLALVGCLFDLAYGFRANFNVHNYNRRPGEIIETPEINRHDQEEAPSTTTREPEVVEITRSSQNGRRVEERLPSREGSAIEIRQVDFTGPTADNQSKGSDSEMDELVTLVPEKRALWTSVYQTWPHVIPYKIHPDYPEYLNVRLRILLKFVESKLCVKFVEEPNFNPMKNKYNISSYILFRYIKQTCSADQGIGKGGPRNVRTCEYWDTMLHELFHSLGVIHEHQAPTAPKYLTHQPENVEKAKRYNFRPYFRPNIESDAFDPTSVMLYDQLAFSYNGLPPLLPLRGDFYRLNNGKRNSYDAIMMELNKVYKCKETACKNKNVDCGKGYYTKVDGECQCVCPDGFSKKDSCNTIINESAGPSAWPDAPFITWAATKNSCPTGFKSGLLKFKTTTYRYKDPSFKDGIFFTLYTCSMPSIKKTLENMPIGVYCVAKPKNVTCDPPFANGGIEINTGGQISVEGEVGDVDIADNTVTLKFCCRNDQDISHGLDLPNVENFRLIPSAHKNVCPRVKGMISRKAKTGLITPGAKRSGDGPMSGTNPKNLFLYSCMYYAPTFDCNKEVTLSPNQRSATIKTPGFDSGKRERNKRCLYSFKVPEGARMMVKFHVYQLEELDQFLVRRFNRWVKPLVLRKDSQVYSFLTFQDFLMMEFHSSDTVATTSAKGVQFTVTMTTKEEMCYDVKLHGQDYTGNKWASDSHEPCVAWKDAMTCTDFPYTGVSIFHVKQLENKCRNPGGKLEEPWCYTYVNGTTCQKRYCDVCNLLPDHDLFPQCNRIAVIGPGYCTTGFQRLTCANACKIQIRPPPPLSSECPEGWNIQGDRCWRWFSGGFKQPEAGQLCKKNDGQIFKIRNKEDVGMIMDFQQASKNEEAKGHLWANGRYSPTVGQYLTIGDQQPLPMLDMRSQANLKGSANPYLIITAFGQPDAGKLDTSPPKAEHSVICEIPRKVTFGPPKTPRDSKQVSPVKEKYVPGEQVTFNCTQEGMENIQVTIELGSEGWMPLDSVCQQSSCQDGSSQLCLNVLDMVPDFCVNSAYKKYVDSFCRQTCGSCSQKNNVQCTAPEGLRGSHATSRSVRVGEVMTFDCNNNMFHTLGDKKRTCLPDGSLNGQDLVCTDYHTPISINENNIISRNSFVQLRTAYVFFDESMRIPRDGQINAWYFFAIEGGEVTFLVFRYDSASQKYTKVGYNTIKMSKTNYKWSWVIPAAKRIRVKAGDYLGMFSTGAKISAHVCSGSLFKVKTMLAGMKKFKQGETMAILNTPQTFEDTCIVPSFGARIQF